MELGRCVFHDGLYERLLNLLPEIDGLVIGSPTYYAGPNGSLCAFARQAVLQRRQTPEVQAGSVSGSSTQRGCEHNVRPSEQVFHHPFHAGCVFPIWNMAYGRAPEEVLQDGEGMQTMRTLGRNMAWLLKKIHASGPLCPEAEMPLVRTNFIK